MADHLGSLNVGRMFLSPGLWFRVWSELKNLIVGITVVLIRDVTVTDFFFAALKNQKLDRLREKIRSKLLAKVGTEVLLSITYIVS